MLHAYLPAKLKLWYAGFDAEFHHYDWRQSIDKLGRELANKIVKETGGSNTDRPGSISIVAHSMGGLVSRRALQILSEKTESDGETPMLDRVNRLVMQGTPNFGSFAPAMVVQGVYPTVKKVAALDLHHTVEELSEELFSGFPGLLELLPSPQKFNSIDLYTSGNWPSSKPRPQREPIKAAKRIHSKLFPGDERCVMICGVNQKTVTSLQLNSDNEFDYLETNSGDGTVPLDFAQLPHAKQNYFVEKPHGKLPSDRRVINATIEILETGTTSLLDTSWNRSRSRPRKIEPAELKSVPFKGRQGDQVLNHEARSIQEEFVAPPERDPGNTCNDVHISASSSEPINIGRQRQHHISLKLAHGSIADVDARAAVLGVFQDVVPSGAAGVFDRLLGGTVTEFVSRNMFSAAVGDVFVLPAARRAFGLEFVVFAGLGRFDNFDSNVLKLVAENVARTLIRSHVDDFAFVPMGGSSGISITDSISCIVEGLFDGILEANATERLSNITIVEFDEKKYLQMRTEVLRLATTPLFDEVEVTVREIELPEPIARDVPSRRHRVIDEKGVEPAYLFVQQGKAVLSGGASKANSSKLQMQTSLLGPTHNATVVSEVIEFDRKQLDKHLEEIKKQTFGNSTIKTFGDELTKMVLPSEIINILEDIDDRPLVVIHDAEASRIPWETIRANGRFIAVEQGLSRRYAAENLSVGKWLDSRLESEKLSILLIVNPTNDLPGTVEETDKIVEFLENNPGVEHLKLSDKDATWNRVKSELSSGKYDIVHYAGHAFFDPQKRSNSGIICHGDKVLSGADLAGLQRLPALAFFNACEAGRLRKKRGANKKPRSKQEIRNWRKTKKASEWVESNVGLAEAFLRGGVANYIGTYWPVGDASAADFAKVFYGQLLGGTTIGESIRLGRKEIEESSVDFADYIHYGNPHFRLKI